MKRVGRGDPGATLRWRAAPLLFGLLIASPAFAAEAPKADADEASDATRADPEAVPRLDAQAEAAARGQRPANAARAAERALRLRELVLGPRHPEIVMRRARLAFVQQLAGRYADAEANYRLAVRLLDQIRAP